MPRLLTAIYALSLMTACLPNQRPVDDVLLAEVFNKRLYQSQANQFIPEDASSQDSILFRNAYIEQWIRESLIMVEAERNLPDNLAIEELVEDYRSSMIKHQYEQQLVENLLDTAISDAELRQYYEDHKSQYVLESIIVRCRFIRLDSTVSEEIRSEIDQIWTTDDRERYQQLLSLVNQHAYSFYLNDSVWHKSEVIGSEMPPGTFTDNVIERNKTFRIGTDNSYYFLKILEVKDEEEIAPLTFIENQAEKVILHKRKIELLQKIKEDLYSRASSQNRIKIY